LAWEQLRDASVGGDIRSARRARTRLATLNLALALLAMQG
jgi:hypothetical protein